MLSVLGPKAEKSEKCGMDHILDAQNKGEISEDNVLHTVENINVAGISFAHDFKYFLYKIFRSRRQPAILMTYFLP